MHDSCTIRVSHKAGSLHSETTVFFPVEEEVKEGNVFNAGEVASFELFNDFEFVFSKEVLQSALSQNVSLLPFQVLHFHINEVGVHCEGEIGGQSPRRGCPSKELHSWVVFEGESDVDRRIIDLFVVLLHFEVGEDSVACIRVRHDSASSVNESTVEEHFEDVPNRLHEI